MNTYETIDLNDYVQTGEGGTSLTYTDDALEQLPMIIG